MDMPRNGFKQALAEVREQPLIGLFLGLCDPYSAEVLATAGFDWLLIDAEHGPNDVRTVLAQLQAVAPYPAHAVVRTNDHSASRIKQLLDAGVQTLLVPMVESAEQARDLVAATRYPPAGIRGVGTALARAARWNAVTDYFAYADAEMCVILQIESRAGLDALDDILAVEGVDAIFLGPADLAASMGHLGKTGHPEIRAAIEDAIRRIAQAGRSPGVFCADPALAKSYQALGTSFMAVGADTTLLRTAGAKLVESFRG